MIVEVKNNFLLILSYLSPLAVISLNAHELVEKDVSARSVVPAVKEVRVREEVPFLVRFRSEDDPTLIYNGILVSDRAALGHGGMNAMRRLVPRPPKRVPSFEAVLGDLDPTRDDERGEIRIRRLTFAGTESPPDADRAFLVLFPHRIEMNAKINPIRMAYVTDSIADDYARFPVTVYGWGKGHSRPLKFSTNMLTNSECSARVGVASNLDFCVEDQSSTARSASATGQNFLESGAAVTVKASGETFLLGMCNNQGSVSSPDEQEPGAFVRLAGGEPNGTVPLDDEFPASAPILTVHAWNKLTKTPDAEFVPALESDEYGHLLRSWLPGAGTYSRAAGDCDPTAAPAAAAASSVMGGGGGGGSVGSSDSGAGGGGGGSGRPTQQESSSFGWPFAKISRFLSAVAQFFGLSLGPQLHSP